MRRGGRYPSGTILGPSTTLYERALLLQRLRQRFLRHRCRCEFAQFVANKLQQVLREDFGLSPSDVGEGVELEFQFLAVPADPGVAACGQFSLSDPRCSDRTSNLSLGISFQLIVKT